ALEKRQQGSSFGFPLPLAPDDADDSLRRDVVGHQTFGKRDLTSGAPDKIARAEGGVCGQLETCLLPIYVQKLFEDLQRLPSPSFVSLIPARIRFLPRAKSRGPGH